MSAFLSAVLGVYIIEDNDKAAHSFSITKLFDQLHVIGEVKELKGYYYLHLLF